MNERLQEIIYALIESGYPECKAKEAAFAQMYAEDCISDNIDDNTSDTFEPFF